MSNLQQLRDEILKLKSLLEAKEKLLIEREKLAEKIETSEKTPDELKKLKASLRHIDTEIDKLDACDEEVLYKLKQEYLFLLLKAQPEKRIEYEKTLLDQSRMKEEFNEINRSWQFLIPIQFHLDLIERARLRIKKLWVLSYLLGNNPNYEITHSWLELRKALDKEIPKKLSPTLQDEIKTFGKIIKERWGLGVIDRQVRPFHIHVKHELAHIEKALSALRERLKKMDDELI